MTPEERATKEGFDMWLLYPPLSAKHLVAVDLPGQAGEFYLSSCISAGETSSSSERLAEL